MVSLGFTFEAIVEYEVFLPIGEGDLSLSFVYPLV